MKKNTMNTTKISVPTVEKKCMNTPFNIKTIEDRANAATPGPWFKAPGPDGYSWFDDLEDISNGDFIAHARTDIPALIAEVLRLQSLFEDKNATTKKNHEMNGTSEQTLTYNGFTTLREALDAHVFWINGEPNGKRADLRGADLSDADLHGADLRNAILTDANLCGADLSNADLSNANLSAANLSGADLSFADLSGANLHGTIL